MDLNPHPQGSHLSNDDVETKIINQENGGSLHQHLVAHSSSGIIDENHSLPTDHDPLVETIFTLQSAQEILEKELFKFKDISNDILGDDSISDLHTECIDAEQRIQPTCSDWFPYREMELEDLFKQKIETEVVYLVTSRMVQDLRVANVNHITVLEEQTVVASEHTQMLDTLRHIENKAAMLKKELECGLDKIAAVDEIIELQKRVCKYGSCFLLQIVSLVVIIIIFMYQISRNYKEATAPT